MHELFALQRLVFVRPFGACTRLRCVSAAALLGGAYDVCAAAAGFACVTALAIAELSTTEAFAACMSCLLCRGLFSCGPTVRVHENDAWVQRRCPAGCMLVHSCYWICRCGGDQEPNYSTNGAGACYTNAWARLVRSCERCFGSIEHRIWRHAREPGWLLHRSADIPRPLLLPTLTMTWSGRVDGALNL
jgi:hypothetical protein